MSFRHHKHTEEIAATVVDRMGEWQRAIQLTLANLQEQLASQRDVATAAQARSDEVMTEVRVLRAWAQRWHACLMFFAGGRLRSLAYRRPTSKLGPRCRRRSGRTPPSGTGCWTRSNRSRARVLKPRHRPKQRLSQHRRRQRQRQLCQRLGWLAAGSCGVHEWSQGGWGLVLRALRHVLATSDRCSRRCPRTGRACPTTPTML